MGEEPSQTLGPGSLECKLPSVCVWCFVLDMGDPSVRTSGYLNFTKFVQLSTLNKLLYLRKFSHTKTDANIMCVLNSLLPFI